MHITDIVKVNSGVKASRASSFNTYRQCAGREIMYAEDRLLITWKKLQV